MHGRIRICSSNRGDLKSISEIKQYVFVYWSYFVSGKYLLGNWELFFCWSYFGTVCFLDCNLEMHEVVSFGE
jgi:hypothetical protein